MTYKTDFSIPTSPIPPSIQPHGASNYAKNTLAATVTDIAGDPQFPYSYEDVVAMRQQWYNKLDSTRQTTVEGIDADLPIDHQKGSISFSKREYYATSIRYFVVFCRHRHDNDTAPATLSFLLDYVRDCLFHSRVQSGKRQEQGGLINSGSYNKALSALLWLRVRGVWMIHAFVCRRFAPVQSISFGRSRHHHPTTHITT